ncbi:MAG: PilZ domain-containing protein [Bradyrhizobium sp.]|uniref:PilZ domain-containing protein n=1 Tax=Bradyrhizobium sp. TaxID=376 RepID=UPI003C7360AF
MPSKLTSLRAIKWVNQRTLADYWDRLAAGRSFPAFTELKSEPGMYDPKQFVVWNVEGQGRQRKFRALYQSENVAEVFGSSWLGKTMDEVVPMSLRRFTLEAARECVASGCLVYMIVSTIDTNGHRVDCEALLLPFGRNDSVEQILTSLRLRSVQGRVQRKKILGNFKIQTDMLFSGKIRSSVGENRRAQRRNVLRAGKISFADQSMTCTVRNVSATGASIEGANLTGTPDVFTLVLEMESTARPCTVVWRKKTRIGVRFT